MSCPCQKDIDSLQQSLDRISGRIGNFYYSSSVNLYFDFTRIQNQQANTINYLNYTGNGNISLYSANVSNILSIGGNTLLINNNTNAKSIRIFDDIYDPSALLKVNGNIYVCGGNTTIRDTAVSRTLKSNVLYTDYIGSNSARGVPSFWNIPQREYIVNGSWTSYVSPGQSYEGVCWSPELGLFCAVSTAGAGSGVMTSPDGVNWTLRSTPVDNGWNDICWSPELGLFAAVAWSGSAQRVMTSSDGITWTAQNTPNSNDYWGICWSPQLRIFVAVAATGSGNRAMTSSDGVNWTAQSTPTPDKAWSSVSWSPDLGIFCAVARPASGNDNLVMTSPDGVNWTLRTSAANNNWQSVAWSRSLRLFAAVSSSGTGNRVMTSPDGITWTSRTSPANNGWLSVVWSPELGAFFSVAISGSGNRIMSSTDGITWTIRTSPVDNAWTSVCWSAELGVFCAVSTTAANRAMVSKSAYNYLPYTYLNEFSSNISFQSYNFANILHLDSVNQRVILNGNSTPIAGSNITIYGNVSTGFGAGNSAYTANVDFPLLTMRGTSTWLLNHFYTSGEDDHLQVKSTLGNTWILSGGSSKSHLCEVDLSSGNPGMNLLGNLNIYHGNVEISAGNMVIDGNINMGSSSNLMVIDTANKYVGIGKSNPQSTLDMIGNLNVSGNITNLNGAVSSYTYNGILYNTSYKTTPYKTSESYRNYMVQRPWNLRTTPNSNGYWGVDWSPQLGLFAAVSINGTGNRVMTSPDGITWTARTSASDTVWVAIKWVADLGLFVALSNTCMTSPDGINWTTRAIPSASYRDVAWSPKLKLLVAVGNGGTPRCATSPDGITWTSRTINTLAWYRVAWSQEVGIFVAVSEGSGTTGRVAYSYDGINWSYANIDSDVSLRGLVWASSMGLFIASRGVIMTSPDGINWTTRATGLPNFGTNFLGYSPELNLVIGLNGVDVIYSFDGINWYSYPHNIVGLDPRSVAWSPQLGIFCAVSNAGTNQAMTSRSMYNYPLSLYLDSFNTSANISVQNTLYVDNTNKRVGILTTTPAYELEVNGTAGKSGGGTWAAPSDLRIKENIESANLELCYENIKKLELKRFKWKSMVQGIQDAHQLGWIAQELKEIYPKSVSIVERYGISDFHDINCDILYKTMYGALKRVILDKEDLEADAKKIHDLLTKDS